MRGPSAPSPGQYATPRAVVESGAGKVWRYTSNPDVATAVRSLVQAAFVVGFCLSIGAWRHAGQLHGARAAGSVVISGICGGLSWIFVFRALQLAPNVKVAPIDKLSLPLGIVLSVLILGETVRPVNWLGIALIVAGSFLATTR